MYSDKQKKEINNGRRPVSNKIFQKCIIYHLFHIPFTSILLF